MSKPLTGIKIAILAANGFDQTQFTAAQRALMNAGATLKVVSPDQGLVNGWEGNAWGHHFAVDQGLSTALGVDYDMLVVPGGPCSMDKLKTTAHTKRFLNSFMTSMKPVVMFEDAVSLLEFAGQNVDVSVHGNMAVLPGADDISAMIDFMNAQISSVQKAA